MYTTKEKTGVFYVYLIKIVRPHIVSKKCVIRWSVITGKISDVARSGGGHAPKSWNCVLLSQKMCHLWLDCVRNVPKWSVGFLNLQSWVHLSIKLLHII